MDDDRRVEICLSLTIFAISVVYLILSPITVIVGIPFIVVGALVAFGALWFFKRYGLSNYWYSQLLAASISWPFVYDSIYFSESIRVLKHSQIAFMVLFFAHVGGAVVWFTGVFRNTKQFPGVTTTFPLHSLISLPLLLAITGGLVYTSVKIAVWASSR